MILTFFYINLGKICLSYFEDLQDMTKSKSFFSQPLFIKPNISVSFVNTLHFENSNYYS